MYIKLRKKKSEKMYENLSTLLSLEASTQSLLKNKMVSDLYA